MEHSKIWRNETFSGVELLSARYTRFEFSKHWHDELSIGIIERGAEGLFYRGSNLIIPQRQIVAINPAEVHTGFPGVSEGWQYRMFYFDVDELTKQFEHYTGPLNPIIEQPVIDDESLFDALYQLHVSLEQPAFELSKESFYLNALETLFTRYGSAKEAPLQLSSKKSSYLARDYLHAHYDSNPSLSDLETVTGSSKFQLIRNFKSVFGVTPHQYLLLTKVNQAKGLLSEGASCVDASLACGFYDQSHFTRNFKKAFGVSPSNYRP
ncbi:AraC family transcriptional regulator [uncultured Vibrio sp.]|uniref:helix-turn-helix domain-containing protein n=1 Tax=uncultured Vibrio sp. TaxID=114054 RepID=UPI0025D92B54|nr:AraC family transcriptional regulator [uncultured Vibrio sp.]